MIPALLIILALIGLYGVITFVRAIRKIDKDIEELLRRNNKDE